LLALAVFLLDLLGCKLRTTEEHTRTRAKRQSRPSESEVKRLFERLTTSRRLEQGLSSRVKTRMSDSHEELVDELELEVVCPGC
jgi:hypothetical protein